MSGLLLVCTWLLGPPLRPPLGPSLGPPLGRGMLGPLLLLAAAEAAGRAGPGVLHGPVASPRMDFEEWTPLGHGDPLKNDPTYDYVPPVLDRVHYWMEESSARRDVDVNAVPVPATMLVPPPLPAATTPAPPPPPAAAFTATPPAYSSLNPFHHFEDRPVVPNVLFEEKPFASFDAPPFADNSNLVLQHQPGPLLITGPTPRPPPPRPASPNASPNAIRSEPVKSSKLAPQMSPPQRAAAPKPAVKPLGRPPGKPTRLDEQPQLPLPPHLPPRQQPPPPPPRAPQPASTPSTTTTSTPPPSTTTRTAAMTTTSASISSLVRGLLHREVATTASTLTTDPLFAHYKQPATPVQGPAYLIIQGHSKVKTYGPVLRRM